MVKKRKDLEKVFERIKFNNKYFRVKIKFRKLKSGYSIYFEYWNGFKNETQFLKQRFLGREDTREEDDVFIDEVEERRLIKEKQSRNDDNFTLKNTEKRIDFIQYYQAICDKKSSRPQYASSLMHFKNFLGKDEISFKDLTPMLFKKFKKYLLELKVKKKDTDELVDAMKPITARGYLDVMRAGLNLAIEDKIITDNPLKGIDVKVEETKREHLTENELKAFIKTETKYPEISKAFLFSCFTGLRLGDIQNLTFKKFEEDVLKFRQQKTRKPETFPLSEDALKIYHEQKELHSNTGKVFELPHKSKINSHLKEMAKAAGIEKNLHYHMSRHTFAILALTSGMSIYEVSKFLGHTDIKTTEIYLKFIPEHKKKAISLMPSFLK